MKKYRVIKPIGSLTPAGKEKGRLVREVPKVGSDIELTEEKAKALVNKVVALEDLTVVGESREDIADKVRAEMRDQFESGLREELEAKIRAEIEEELKAKQPTPPPVIPEVPPVAS